MCQWYVFIRDARIQNAVIEAPDRPTALRAARQRFGWLVTVQSVASWTIAERDRDAVARNGRLGIRDSDRPLEED